MREIVLHRLWLTQSHLRIPMRTTAGTSLEILWVGCPNKGSGPDILFSRIRIGDQLWCGHVEIHLRASDWHRHGHHQDPGYNTVVLHVVWSADTEVRREDGTTIPALELSQYLSESQLPSFKQAYSFRQDATLPCHSLLRQVPGVLISSWLEELFSRRMEEKSREVLLWYKEVTGDWEAVFFRALLKGFGLNKNGEAFLSLSSALPFGIVRKLQPDLLALESVLFGLSGLLEKIQPADAYTENLMGTYRYQRSKYRLSRDACHQPVFFSLRPGNFPTLRLSQLANLYNRNSGLFHRVCNCLSLPELRSVLQTCASTYWETHFTFGRTCAKRSCETTKLFTDLLLLNTVFPVLIAYGKSTGTPALEKIKYWSRQIRAEENAVVRQFKKEGIEVRTALGSQALLQLYKAFCLKNKCLQCPWGEYLLYGKY